MTKVHHRPIVEYAGSITDMHGLWRIESTGEWLTLVSAYGLTLRYVRPANVKPVAVHAGHRAGRLANLGDSGGNRCRPSRTGRPMTARPRGAASPGATPGRIPLALYRKCVLEF